MHDRKHLEQVSALIVDDDELFRNGVKRVMRSMRGVSFSSVEEASTGAEGLLVFERHPAQVILLDYQMPGGTGTSWLDKFRALDEDVAVIMVTGRGDEAIAVEAMRSGASDYLVKGSFTGERLTQAIIAALDRRQMRQALDQQGRVLIEAERQRVMLESLGAACHHMGQPATIMMAYLELLKEGETDPERRQMINQCIDSANRMAEILHKLQTVTEYRTVPYVKGGAGEVSILDIGPFPSPHIHSD
ncbi:MAG: response regulator [Kiritimatiellae bacterium]|nr:response regulator [Kiritimatiellia bacterium]